MAYHPKEQWELEMEEPEQEVEMFQPAVLTPQSWKEFFQGHASWRRLTFEQEHAVDRAAHGCNVFLSGAAGTGKSMTTRLLIKLLKQMHGESKVLVTASTGIAGRNISGKTLHSALRFGKAGEDATFQELMGRVWKNDPSLHCWTHPTVLVIDEVSMISAHLWDKLDIMGRVFRQKRNAPWGGLQVIAVGDFLQLKPVGAQAKYAFDGQSWKNMNFAVCMLTKVFRQQDPNYIRCLNLLREGRLTASTMQFLKSKESLQVTRNADVTLLPHRKSVDAHNREKMENLRGQSSWCVFIKWARIALVVAIVT